MAQKEAFSVPPNNYPVNGGLQDHRRATAIPPMQT
jgi:hypothetical protein